MHIFEFGVTNDSASDSDNKKYSTVFVKASCSEDAIQFINSLNFVHFVYRCAVPECCLPIDSIILIAK